MAHQAVEIYGAPTEKVLAPHDQSHVPSTVQEIQDAKFMASEHGEKIVIAVLGLIHLLGTARIVYRHEGLNVQFIPAEILVATSDPNFEFRRGAIRMILGTLGAKQAIYESGKLAAILAHRGNITELYSKVGNRKGLKDNHLAFNSNFLEWFVRHDAPIEKSPLKSLTSQLKFPDGSLNLFN